MPLCSLILPPVSVSCTVSFLFVLSGTRFSFCWFLRLFYASFTLTSFLLFSSWSCFSFMLPCIHSLAFPFLLTFLSLTLSFSFFFFLSSFLLSSFIFRFSFLVFVALRFLYFFPSLLAFQLSIRVRLTQLTSLVSLEPLDFRPFGFSPLFSLLMSTFLLLIAFISPTFLFLFSLQNTLLPSFRNSCFGHHLSLFYLWCHPSPQVRCYAFIIRMAASMPTASLSSISHSLPHFNVLRDLIILSGLSPS